MLKLFSISYHSEYVSAVPGMSRAFTSSMVNQHTRHVPTGSAIVRMLTEASMAIPWPS